jgi:CRISPR-associated protein Csm5
MRVAKLVPKSPGSYALGWKGGTRAAIDGARPQDSTAWFAEMADPGTVFRGAWTEHAFLGSDEVRRLSRWQGTANRSRFIQAANGHAERLLALQRQYAAWTKLERVGEELTRLEGELAKAKESGGCLLSIGAGGGLLTKTAFPDTGDAEYRRILKSLPFYSNALNGLPFPKTRRIVFLAGQPASLPGWVRLDVDSAE